MIDGHGNIVVKQTESLTDPPLKVDQVFQVDLFHLHTEIIFSVLGKYLTSVEDGRRTCGSLSG